jgi:uncharacterized protein (DUF2147 family)
MKAFSHALSLVLGVALGAMALIGAASAAGPMDPRGLWLRQEGGVQFSFYDCETGLLCAKVVGAENPADRTGIGTVILRGAKKVAANEWRGTLYNTEDGKSYDGYISVRLKGAELSVKGCVMGFLCRDETWTRLPSPAARAASSNKSAPTASLAAAE